MEEDDYPFDHAAPLRWYHLPILGLAFTLEKFADIRCKLFGHKPIHNGGLCDRCNRHLD